MVNGWGFDPIQTVKIAKLMTDTVLWSQHEVVDGTFHLNY